MLVISDLNRELTCYRRKTWWKIPTQKVSSNEQDGGIALVCSVSQDFLAHGN